MEYKYYAIKVGVSVIFRRSLKGLKQITSTITSPTRDLRLTQIVYSGGIVIGTMPYDVWYKKTKLAIPNGYLKIDKDQFVGLLPFMVRIK